jgi:FlaA1/EpsC-like NDP-sugar epimerase
MERLVTIAIKEFMEDKLMDEKLAKFYEGKTVLVTGAVGSIGSEIVRRLLQFEVKVVRALDIDETGLFDLEQELQSKKIRLFIGDVRDKERLRRAVEDTDIIFHAAALKHVPLCEYNPFEAVKTNVLGTQNLIDVAMDANVEKFLTISTDKAVNPVNVLGATKLLAERLTISANFYKGKRRIVFSCVRFGNVLGSRGSVVPVFRRQIESGGTVSVTSQNMTRFVMSMSDAVTFILRAAKMAKGGENFILKMPAVKIIDLAEVMIQELAPKYGYKPKDIKLKIIGNRAGEKLYEELLTEDEAMKTYERNGILVVTSRLATQKNEHSKRGWNKPKKYTSNNTRLLTKAEIKKLLTEIGLI